MVRLVAASAVVLALAVAGCAGTAGPEAGTPDPSATGTASQGPGGTQGNASVPRLLGAQQVTLYFAEGGQLLLQPPAAGAVPFGLPAGGFASGFDPPAFDLAPAPWPALVLPADIAYTVYVASDAPQATAGLDLALWFGTSEHTGLSHIQQGAPVHLPGAPQVYEGRASFGDKVGFYVPAGGSVRAIASGHVGGESGNPRMLVGGDTASRITLTLQNYTLDPIAGAVPQPEMQASGTVVNGGGIACIPAPGSTQEVPVEVLPDAASLRLRLSVSGPTLASADNDLHLLHGDTVVASGTSIRGEESILLAADLLDGLAGKTLTALVSACGPGPIPFELAVEQATLPT